jgi:hypothetical protein
MPAEERQSPQGRNSIIRWGVIALFVIMIGGFFVTMNARHDARNDGRVGTTTENSQKNPGAQPTAPEKGGSAPTGG